MKTKAKKVGLEQGFRCILITGTLDASYCRWRYIRSQGGRKDHWSRYNLVGPLHRLSLSPTGVSARYLAAISAGCAM